MWCVPMMKWKLPIKRVYTKWFLSYLILILVFSIAWFMMYRISKNIVVDQTRETNKYLLENMKIPIELEFSSAVEAAAKLAVDDGLVYLSKTNGSYETISRYDTLRVIKNINQYKIGNADYENWFAIFPKNGLCLSNSGSYSHEIFKDAYVTRLGEIKGDIWDDIVENKPRTSFEALSTKYVSGRYVSNYAFVRSVPLVEKESIEGIIIVKVNGTKIQDTLNLHPENSECFIVDKKGYILYSSKILDYETQNIENLGMDAARLISLDNTHEKIYSTITSELTGLTYVMATDAKIYARELTNLKNSMMICMFLAVLVCIAVSVRMVSFNYAPIKEILNAMQGTTNIDGNSDVNLIKERFAYLYKTIHDKDRIIRVQKKNSKYLLVADILMGYENNDKQFAEKCREYGMDFISNKFCVAIFKIEDFGDILIDEESKKVDWATTRFIVQNIVEELFDERHKAYVCIVNGVITCLINYNPCCGDDYIDVKDICLKSIEYIKKYFHVDSVVALSPILEGCNGASVAYYQAIELLNYRNVNLKKNLISADENCNAINYTVKFDKNDEKKLKAAISIGNSHDATDIIRGIYERNIINGYISVKHANMIIHKLSLLVFDIIEDISTENISDFGDQLERLRQLSADENAWKAYDNILHVVNYICDKVKSGTLSSGELIYVSAKNIIDENYIDVNLNSKGIADQLDVTNPYMLRVFKRYYPDGFTEYLHRVRINKSKALLTTTNMTVAEIAEKVGYVNSNVYIRAFKKEEYMTPSVYRRNNQAK